MSNEHYATPFKVAAIQATPVFHDREATIDKACELIATAGREGARLIVFPEAFIPSYPDWVWAIPSGEQGLLNELYAELLSNSVTIPGDATDRLCKAANLYRSNVGLRPTLALNNTAYCQRRQGIRDWLLYCYA